MIALLLACASLARLTELEELPADFPLAVDGELGRITTPQAGGQVSVDVVHPSQEAARETWKALRQQAEFKGFEVTEEGHRDKRDRVILERPSQRIELGCCRQRADRQWLVFVTAWKLPTE